MILPLKDLVVSYSASTFECIDDEKSTKCLPGVHKYSPGYQKSK
jgi:hypothetical protein